MEPTRGRFITLEGIEGAGKSSTALRLKERIETSFGVRCELTREPGARRSPSACATCCWMQAAN